jgi:lipid A 3-O-deacylase
LLQDRDGLYTSGSSIRVSTHVADANQVRVAGWHLGQDQYTPQDVKLLPQQISLKDHPYAAWLYTGWFSEAHQADGGYWKSNVDFGCIGPCARGEQVQRSLHRLINQPEPQGWSRQVKNEFGVQLGMAFAPRRYALGPNADFTPSVQARFGNIYTDASVSAVVRLGQLNNLPQQATNHLFFRADARGVGHNASLQGGYFSNGNVHTVSPKPWVGEVELGWVWHGGAWATRVGVVRRSNEIKSLSNGEGAQNYARLQFGYTP